MTGTSRAQTEQKSAKLSEAFGYDYAVRLFGQETIDALPVLKAGPNKGKPAGYVIWLKTTTPGYCVYNNGGTPAGVVVRAWIAQGPFSGQSDAVQGTWCGRPEKLCLSRVYLGEQGRAYRLAAA